MQVEGGDPVTLSPGQVFYENPDDIHVVGRNASETVPARFVAHILKPVGAPVLVPVGPAERSQRQSFSQRRMR